MKNIYNRQLFTFSVIFSLISLVCGGAYASDLARLYAAEAPAGSSFVRIAYPGENEIKLVFANKESRLDPKRKIATDYRVVNPATPFLLQVDGHAIGKISVPADKFITIVLTPETKPGYLMIVDATGDRNDLKAKLHFYNLMPACVAGLVLQNGANVFDGLNYGEVKSRSINPVKASLKGACVSGTNSEAIALPVLKPGDHFSFFLYSEKAGPRLSGQVNITEPFAGNR